MQIPYIVLYKTVLKFLQGLLQLSTLPRTTEVCTQSGRIFRFSSVVWGNLGNYSKHRGIFDAVLCRKIWGVFFFTLPHKIWLSITKVMSDFTGSGIREPNHANQVIGHLVFDTVKVFLKDFFEKADFEKKRSFIYVPPLCVQVAKALTFVHLCSFIWAFHGRIQRGGTGGPDPPPPPPPLKNHKI